jgi:phospholipid transport system substrate-binding protein
MSARRFSTLTLLLFVLAAPLSIARADAAQDPQAFIQNLAQTALQAVADGKLSDADRSDRFRKLFISSFDLPEISRIVLARYWKTASPDQQKEFQKLFEDLQVVTWTQRFKDYHGDGLTVSGTTPNGDKAWLVESQLVHNPSPPVPVQWKVRQSDDGHLLITDIVVEGVSMAITERQDYAAAMQGNGGNFDALLASIRAKIAQLQGGK